LTHGFVRQMLLSEPTDEEYVLAVLKDLADGTLYVPQAEGKLKQLKVPTCVTEPVC
jgi:DNA polymerase III epsilon subunit-like protein